MKRMILAAGAAVCAATALADFRITIDPAAKPLKDVRQSTCAPIVGYAGCLSNWERETNGKFTDDFLYITNRYETARILRESGAWFQRMWSANKWFARRKPNPHDPNSKDPKVRKWHSEYYQTNPMAAFKFWQEEGFKIIFTLECWGKENIQENKDFVDFIVSNKFESVVAGFELGNESYFGKPENMPNLCANWEQVIPYIKKKMPKVDMGIPICELYELNPDLEQVKNRLMAAGELKRDGYFSASYCNQTSLAMINCLSNSLKDISHIIYHAYGAETPYSCSYYGFQRFRNFAKIAPEIKDKKFWLTEIRIRSDEDIWCQRMFRESLITGHYALMAICQPDCDGFNNHEMLSWAGGIYYSNNGSWQKQWPDDQWHRGYPDYRTPKGGVRFEVGSMGVMYRILAEAIKENPILIEHGTSKEAGTEDTFFTSARVCDEVYSRRRALKEGKTDGVFGGAPKVNGECEWVASVDPQKRQLCLMMVNSKPTAEKIEVTAPGWQFAAPTYRTVSCPDDFVDCRAVPGEAHPWRELAWEDTQQGYGVIKMAMNEMPKDEGGGFFKPKSDVMRISIAPNTVQSVIVPIRREPKPKETK